MSFSETAIPDQFALAILVAIAVIIATKTVINFLAGRRERMFRIHEDQSRSKIIEKYALPAPASSDTTTKLSALSALAGEGHRAAIDAQNKYHAAVAGCAAGLFLGF